VVKDVQIKETILGLLPGTHLRLTPSDLERSIRRDHVTAQRKDIRRAIRDLVSQGKLSYTQHNSTTHLELNVNRPIHIGDRIVLCPSHLSTRVDPERVTIKLQDGTAFGCGDHPTTRLMLQGLDLLLQKENILSMWRALDIGTGTGVLAIAAAMLGVTRVDAVDIDPAACHEAKKNVVLNHVEDCVQISQKPLDLNSGQKYNLIIANLRPPTIMKLIPMMKAVSAPSSIWIISGCRLNECSRLKTHLSKSDYRSFWQVDVTGWAAFAVEGPGDTFGEK